jgi:hypothetical protein
MENSEYIIGNLETNTTKSIPLESNSFWWDNPKTLYEKKKMSQFFPSYDMTLVEKLNAMTRLSIILSIVLYLTTKNYLYFFIMIFVIAFTLFIYFTQKENMELFFNSEPNSTKNKINEEIIKDYETKEIQPTVNNPFMNINLITSPRTQEQAPKMWNDPELKKEVEDKYQYNLYRDVGDIYNKDNGQLYFYQMPSTTIPNEQTAFAKWCYSTGYTCKENSIACVPQIPIPEFPSISTTNPYDFTVRKY